MESKSEIAESFLLGVGLGLVLVLWRRYDSVFTSILTAPSKTKTQRGATGLTVYFEVVADRSVSSACEAGLLHLADRREQLDQGLYTYQHWPDN